MEPRRGATDAEIIDVLATVALKHAVHPAHGPERAAAVALLEHVDQQLRDESRKILSLPELPVSGTCVRVPVYRPGRGQRPGSRPVRG